MAAPAHYADGKKPFPIGPVFILALCLTVNSYTLVNLFPYVGMMVKHLLGLATTNEAGEKSERRYIRLHLRLRARTNGVADTSHNSCDEGALSYRVTCPLFEKTIGLTHLELHPTLLLT